VIKVLLHLQLWKCEWTTCRTREPSFALYCRREKHITTKHWFHFC